MVVSTLIFLYSQSPRSGHNFVAEVIRRVIDCETPLGLRSELPLAAILKSYKKGLESYYKSNGGDEYLNKLFIEDLRKKMLLNKTNCFIKNTIFTGADVCLETFPEDKHIISFRDPKDCVLSLFKGMRLKNDFKSRIKRLLIPTGLYHFTYSRKYAKRIQSEWPQISNFFVLKYEDLVLKDVETLQRIIHFFEASMSVEELSIAIDGIQIINTSFYNEETDSKKIWEASPKTKKFNPINRTKGFNKLQLLGVALGCRGLRKKMGYI